MRVESFLSASRRISKKPIPPNLKYAYEVMFQAMKPPKPELIVIFSSARKSELIQFDDRYYLVFDENLSRYLFVLNCTFLYSISHINAQIQAYRYLADRFRDKGCLSQALAAAIMYDKLHGESKPINDKDKVLDYLTVQNIFIMAHEYAHFVFKSNRDRWAKDKEYTLQKIENYLRKFDYYDSKGKSYLEKEYGISVYEQNTIESFLRRTTKTIIGKDAYFLEEVAADSFATVVAQKTAQSSWRIDSLRVAEGIALALRHLRFIHILELILEDYADHEALIKRINTHLIMSSIRVGVNRNEVPLFWKIREDEKIEGDKESSYNKEDTIHARLVEMSDRYADAIDDPILFGVIRNLDVINNAEGIPENMEEAEIGQRIDELTGWA